MIWHRRIPLLTGSATSSMAAILAIPRKRTIVVDPCLSVTGDEGALISAERVGPGVVRIVGQFDSIDSRHETGRNRQARRALA